MRNTCLAITVAALLGTAGGAWAGPAPRTHDGFFLQMDLGPGYLWSSASQGGSDAKFSGGAGQFSIALGGAITPNFILAGRLWGAAASDPDLEVNGQKGSTTDTTLSVGGIGVDLTYYFMPMNAYVSVTPSIGTQSIKRGGVTFDTKNGFAIRLAAGKEWWVSDNWGIGFNVQYAHSSNAETGGGPTWGSNWVGAAFSATYN